MDKKGYKYIIWVETENEIEGSVVVRYLMSFSFSDLHLIAHEES